MQPNPKAKQQHPAEQLFGGQNAHMMQSMRATQRAVDWLILHHFTVLSVVVRDRNPVIWIAASARCAQLDGGTHVITDGPKGRREVMAATVEGCQVHWRVN